MSCKVVSERKGTLVQCNFKNTAFHVFYKYIYVCIVLPWTMSSQHCPLGCWGWDQHISFIYSLFLFLFSESASVSALSAPIFSAQGYVVRSAWFRAKVTFCDPVEALLLLLLVGASLRVAAFFLSSGVTLLWAPLCVCVFGENSLREL